MKVLANETKRILAVLLSVAMIFAYVPNNVAAYADDEIEDAQSDVQTVEDGGDIVDTETDALNDVSVWFNKTADGDNTPIGSGKGYRVYDLREVENTSTKGDGFKNDAKKGDPDATTGFDGHSQGADHTNGYSFILEPEAGMKFKDNIVKSLKYTRYTSDTDGGREITISTKSGNWSVEDYDNGAVNYGSKKVTITADALKAAYDAGWVVSSSCDILGRELSVEFETTVTEDASIIVPIKCYDDSVKLVDRIPSEFSAKLNDDDRVSLSSNVINFASYKIDQTGNFLSVEVYDKDGLWLPEYTQMNLDSGTTSADGKILDLQNTSATTDYNHRCSGFATAIAIEDLKTTPWVAYVSKNGYKTYNTATTPMLYKGEVIISKAALQAIYSKGYSAAIVVSAAEEPVGDWTVTYADANKYVKYNNADGVTKAPDNVANGDELKFKVAAKPTTSGSTRHLGDVFYSVGGADEKNATPDGTGIVTISSSDTTDNISLRTETFEEIAVSGLTDAYVFSTAGTQLVASSSTNDERAVDGKKYSFLAVAKEGKKISSVQTKLGTSVFSASTFDGGLYSTKDVVEDKVGISVATVDNTSEAGSSHMVKLTSSPEGVYTVRAINNDFDTITTTNQDLVEDGKPFYFTLKKETGHEDDKIESVAVKVGQGNTNEIKPIAENKADHTYYYVVTGADKKTVSDTIEITVKTSASADLCNVYAIKNTKATFDFAKAGRSVKAGKGKKFNFKVNPTNSTTTKITEVGWFAGDGLTGVVDDYENDGYEKHVEGTSAGGYDFTVPNDVDSVVVYALTEEIVPSSDYRYEFVDSVNNRVVSTYSPVDYKSIDFLTGQKLNMVLTISSSDLGNTKVHLYNKTTRTYEEADKCLTTANTTARHGELEFELTDKTSNVVVIDKNNKAKITPHAKGTTTLKATFKVDDSNADRKELNRLVYSKDLETNVTGLYKKLYIDSTTDAFYPSATGYDNYANLSIRGVDAQTGNDVPVEATTGGDVKSIEWTFVNSIEKIPVAERNYQFTGGYGYKATSNYPSVYAKKTTPESFQVKATVTYKDGTEEIVPAKTLKCVQSPAYHYFFVTRTSGALVKDDYTTWNDGAVHLGLAADDIKTLNISYDVYRVLNETRFANLVNKTTPTEVIIYDKDTHTFNQGLITKEELAKAEEKGYIESVEVTEGKAAISSPGAELYNSDGHLLDGEIDFYATFDGEDGLYSLTGLQATPTEDMEGNADMHYIGIGSPEITINGVKREELNVGNGWVYADVVDSKVKRSVNLILYDSVETKEGDPTTTVVTEHKLKSDFIASRPYSEIESKLAGNKDDGAYTYGKVTGVKFLSIPEDSSFVLPTADDFATTPYSNRILVGWQSCSTIDSEGIGTVDNEYFKPGDSDDIDGDKIYKAVWWDRYGISEVTNGNVITTGQDDYDETIKDAKKYDSPIGNIVVGGVIPVVLKVSEAYSINTAGDTATTGDWIESKDKYVTTGFDLAVTEKYKASAEAIKIGKDKDNRPTISGNKLAESESAKVGVTATWNSGSGIITKDSAAFNVLEPKTFKLDVDTTDLSVEEGQDPETVIVKTKLTVDKDGTDYDINDISKWSATPGDGTYNDPTLYSFVWSNDSAAEAQYATAQTKYDKQPIDPEATTGHELDTHKNKIINYISGLKKTTTPVKLTLTATNAVGQIATKTINVTVNEPDVSIKLYRNNKAKSEITNGKFEAFAKSVYTKDGETVDPDDTNSFLLKAIDKDSGDVTNDGSWSLSVPTDSEGLNNVLLPEQRTTLANIADGSGYKVAQLLTEDTVDQDKLVIKYTAEGVTYCKEIEVSTCYAIALPGRSNVENEPKKSIYVTENGTRVVDDKGKPSTAFIRLGVDKKVKADKGTSFSFEDISLQGYSAEYENTDTKPDTRTFDHWTDGTYDYTTEVEYLRNSDFTDGLYTLRAVVTPELKLTGVPGKVTLTHDTPTVVNIRKDFDIEVEPYESVPEYNYGEGDEKVYGIYARSEDIRFFTVNNRSSGNDFILLDDADKAKTKRTGTLKLAKAGTDKDSWRAGKTTINYYATATSSKVLGTTTLYVDGLDYDEETEVRSYYEQGEKVKSTMRTVYDSDAKTSTIYYFDVSGNQITGSGVYDIDGKKVLILAGNVAEKGVQLFEGKEYLVEGDAGEIAVAKLVDVNGVQRYANSDGVLVTYAMATNGKYTDPATGITYVIDPKTNAATLDDILYDPSVKWTKDFESTWKKSDGMPTLTYQITATSKQTGQKRTVSGLNATATEKEKVSQNGVEKITLEAVANLSGYFKDAEGKAPATAANVTSATTTKTYTFKKGSDEGKSGGDAEPGKTESEPAESDVDSYKSFNLFYSSQRVIPVPGLSDVLADGQTTLSGKAGTYYEITDGGVKVKATDAKTIKKAASAANSLIQEGTFSYQLPVYYQKPTLKLTSKKGIRKKDNTEVVLKTQITEKKSSGNYEPIALSDGDITVEGDKLKAALADDPIEIDETTVKIKTKGGKGSGKLVVQAKDGDEVLWAEPIKLSYQVSESSKDIVEVSTKTIKMNAKATGTSLDGEKVTVTFNGQEEFEGVTADQSKLNGSGVEVDGIDESGNVGHELTFKYSDAGVKKGNYKVVLKGGNSSKVTINVKVADSDLSKAVKFTVKSKMDVTKKQKMVLIPKLQTVGGEIAEEVKISDANYEAQYYPESNKIVVGPADDDWSKISATKSFTFQPTLTVTVAGIECPVALKTKVEVKKPSVKIATVTFKKAGFPGTDAEPLSGYTNVLATYKQNGKTFSIEPKKEGGVTFDNGTAVTDITGGDWFKDSKTNAYVKYDATTGKIYVATNSGTKKGSVKVTVTFDNGVTVKKGFKIATKK